MLEYNAFNYFIIPFFIISILYLVVIISIGFGLRLWLYPYLLLIFAIKIISKLKKFFDQGQGNSLDDLMSFWSYPLSPYIEELSISGYGFWRDYYELFAPKLKLLKVFNLNYLTKMFNDFVLYFLDILNIVLLSLILCYFIYDLLSKKINKNDSVKLFNISVITSKFFFFKKYSFILLFYYFTYVLLLNYNSIELNYTKPVISFVESQGLYLFKVLPDFFLIESIGSSFKNSFFFLSFALFISFLFNFSLQSFRVSQLYSTILEFRLIFWLLYFFLINLIQVDGLIGFYIILEGSTLAFILLILFFFTDSVVKRGTTKLYDQKILESGGKYFCLSGLASIFLIVGICFIYGLVGCTSFSEISYYFNSNEIFFSLPFLVIATTFLFASLLFKLSIFPCHFWTPDVYEGLDYGLLIILATVVKVILFVLTIKFIYLVFYPVLSFFNFYLYMFSTLSVLVGAFSALSQTKIKRFLAYSSINQLGFFLLATLEGTYLGLVVSLVAIFIYSVTLVLFIYYIGNSTVLVNSLSKQVSPLFVKSNATSVTRYYPMRRFLESKSNQVSRPINYLTDLLMIWQKSPGIAVILVILLCSWAGIPPFTGFFSKFGILGLIFTSPFSLWVLFFLIINAIPSYYYLRIIKIIYFDVKGSIQKHYGPVWYWIRNPLKLFDGNPRSYGVLETVKLQVSAPLGFVFVVFFHLGFVFYINKLWPIFTLIADNIL